MRPDLDIPSRLQLEKSPRGGIAQLRQGGFVLIISLLLLMLLTVVAVSLSRTFFLEEGISGNLREKERSFNAAQSALRYAEWWLIKNSSFGTPCVATNSAIPIQVCTNPLVNANVVPWSIWVDYLPVDNSNQANVMRLSATGGADTYVTNPGFYIQYIGTGVGANAGAKIFLITAYGYGGNIDAVSVVQSVYAVSSGVVDLGSQQ